MSFNTIYVTLPLRLPTRNNNSNNIYLAYSFMFVIRSVHVPFAQLLCTWCPL